MRIVEILVAANAVCGIAAFLLARGAWNKFKSSFDDEERPQ